MSIRTKPNICYAQSILYKPEFAYAPPQGYRAESFIIPFTFQVIANGEIQADNPWKLDDDVPWVFRGMVWPQIGTAEAAPVVMPLGAASLTVGGVFTVTATIAGAAGNSYTLAFVDLGIPNTPLSVAVVGTAVTVTLQDNVGGVNISTYAQIAAAINTNPAASALMTASSSSAAIAGAFAATNLAGGAGVALLGIPMLVRVRDTNGNPLTTCNATNGYVLSMGAIGQSGFDSINAFGFPFGCEILCEPGGVILFDFQIPVPAGGPATVVTVNGTMLGVKLFKDC